MASRSGLLDGLRALVVGGGGQGIGAAITEGIAAAGADVAVADVDEGRAAAAADSAAKYGRKVVPIAADIRDPDSIERMVTTAGQALGGLDVVVTVVGGLMAFGVSFNRLEEVTDDAWDFVFDINLKYVYRVLKAALKVMTAQGTGGSIVSIGSDAGTAATARPTWPPTARPSRAWRTWS